MEQNITKNKLLSEKGFYYMDKIPVFGDATLIGDKYLLIPQTSEEEVPIDVNLYIELASHFNIINKINDIYLETLYTNQNLDGITVEDITKIITTLIRYDDSNEDNKQTIVQFLLKMIEDNINTHKNKIASLIKDHYEEPKENSTEYHSDEETPVLFEEDKNDTLWEDHMKGIREKLDNNYTPEIEVVPHDEADAFDIDT